MPEFLTPTDIGNRALQHVGVRQMDSVLGFNESSLAAREVSFAYGKLRRAELRRNIWRFATRKATLRPLDTNTMLVAPTLWVSTTTYFAGSIVSDSAGTLWESQIANNLANPPGSSPGIWQPYFGPLTVSLYDSSQFYMASELVYTAAGDGTYNVFKSNTSNNAVHPALPNQWSTSTTYFKNQVVQTWPAYSAGTTYSQGQGIVYTDGNVYASLVNSNTGNTPPSSATKWALVPVLTLQSQPVPVQSIVSPPSTSPVLEWAQGMTYSLGSVVMFNGAEYLSIANSNTGNFPNASGSTFWVAISNYTLSMSLIDLNIGNNPATTSPSNWSSLTTYAAGNTVNGSDGVTYTSIGNGNLNHDPTLDVTHTFWTKGSLTPWTAVFTQGGGNDLWLQVGGALSPSGVALTDVNLNYPLGSGPSSQWWTKNAYRLPSGYLRPAPQDPKAGSSSFLGAPGNSIYDDWVYEGNYFTTMDGSAITFRFVADIQDVTQMDDMFCEGLACRIGEEVCERLTQSTAKVQVCQLQYRDTMGRAILVNGIETAPTEPPLDDFIACRY